MQDLKGKVALVTGIINKRSIAYAAAEVLAARGAKVIVSYLPVGKENEEAKITKQTESIKPALIVPLDVTDNDSIISMFDTIGKKFGHLHILVHSIASAKRDELDGAFSDTSLEGFLYAHQVSAYSLIELTKHARPLMTGEGGSIITLSYIGSERAVKNYNVMGSAKASLESNVRYLAMELGEQNIRVNAISAGPIRTVSASGVRDFLDLLHNAAQHSALKRNITQEEVGNTVGFLASSLSSGITGQILYVDGGYNIHG